MNASGKIPSAETKQQILEAISGHVVLPPVSRSYFTGLLLTAFAVLTLPLLYLAVILLLSGGQFVFLWNAHRIFDGWHPAIKWLIISLVSIVNIGFLLGLIKPFFATTLTAKRPRILRRNAEPFLYQYIDRLCDALGIPHPTDIRVTQDLNAAVEFRQGFLSLFGRREISLYIGLPIVAGMSLEQFTGILGHELGHFAQRMAIYLEKIVSRTNQWFFNAAYDIDSVDRWLLENSRSGLFGIPCHVVRGVIGMTRYVMRGLVKIGQMISCQMSREMEFNADRCQARTVGCQVLASAMWQMRNLSLAHQFSLRDISAFYDEGRLPDDMIALVIANLEFITPKIKKKLRRIITEEKTGTFDTHPSDYERIQAAFVDGSTGFFQRERIPAKLPASILFSHFEELCKAVTLEFYQTVLNQRIKSQSLYPVDKLMERQSVQIKAAKALRRYFQTDIPLLRPLPIASQSTEPPENPAELVRELKSSRQRMIQELAQYRQLIPRYRAAEETLFELIEAQSLIDASIPFKPNDFHLQTAVPEAVSRKSKRARESIANLAGKLLPFETEAGHRLSFSLQLLQVPAIVQKIPDGNDLYYEIRELLPEAIYVSRLMAELPSIRLIHFRLVTISKRLEKSDSSYGVMDKILDQMATLSKRLISLQAEMGDHLYPFDHAKADTTLRSHALPEIPAATDLGGLVAVTDQLQQRLITIQARLFARLAFAAEKVESAIGLPPLPEPEQSLTD